MKTLCNFYVWLIAATLAVVLAGCVTPSSAQRGALFRAEDSLATGHAQDTLGHLARARQYGDLTPAETARAYWLEGQAQEQLQHIPEAVAAYRRLVQLYPQAHDAGLAKERLSKLAP